MVRYRANKFGERNRGAAESQQQSQPQEKRSERHRLATTFITTTSVQSPSLDKLVLVHHVVGRSGHRCLWKLW